MDCSLVFQYFYYTWHSKPSPGHPRSLISGAGARRLSIDRGTSRYRTLSAVAANVAAAAALAAQQNEQLDHRRRRQRWHSEDRERLDRRAFDENAAEDDVDDDGLAAMTVSFHSEGGHEPRPKRVSWSNERHSRRGGSVDHLSGRSSIPPPLQLTSTDSLIDPTGRGRSLQREVDDSLQIHHASTDRRSSRTSRRTTMIFLGAWAFFGIGALAGGQHSIAPGLSPPIGRVLAVKSLHVSSIVDSRLSYDTSLNSQLSKQWSERVIGRIFAWLCTTLYLTSRLPQIWKNVRPLRNFPGTTMLITCLSVR